MGICMSEEDKKIMLNDNLLAEEKIGYLNAITLGPTEDQNKTYDNKQKALKIDLFNNFSTKKKVIIKELYWKY